MKRELLCLLSAVALCAGPAAAGSADEEAGLEVVKAALGQQYVWPEAFLLRGSFTGDDARFSLACAGSGRDVRVAALVAYLPIFALGPLAPGGLVRETLSPLQCGAGADAVRERTGFTVSGSPTFAPIWMELRVVEDAAGVFARAQTADSAPVVGCYAAVPLTNAIEIEGVCSVDATEDSPHACTAVRLFCHRPSFWIIASLAGSGGEKTLPGACSSIRIRLEQGGLSAHFLAGMADRTYLAPAGDRPANRAKLETGWLFSGSVESVGASYSIAFRQPGPFPRRFLETHERATLTIERPLGPELSHLRGRIEASKTLDSDGLGARMEESLIRCSAMLDLVGVSISAAASFDSRKGFGVSCSTDLTLGSPRSRASLRAAVSTPELKATVAGRGGAAVLDARFALRCPIDDGTFMVEAGFEDLPMEGRSPCLLDMVYVSLAKEVSAAFPSATLREYRSAESLSFP